jgi:hypothetical protein
MAVRPVRGASLLACLAAACQCGTDLGPLRFACATTQDCAAGEACVQGICTSGAPDGGGSFDAGLADAGGGTDAGLSDSGSNDGGLDAGDPCGSLGPSLLDAGEVAAYCAIHRTLTIDGSLSDWSGVPFTPLTQLTAQSAPGDWTFDPTLDDADLSGSFALQWDEQYLYFAASIVDNVRALHPASNNYYADDAVELFWSGSADRSISYDAGDHQVCLRADNAGEQFTGADNGTLALSLPVGVVSATLDAGGEANWTVEVAIPWSQLALSGVSAGSVIGFDVIFDDDDDAGTQVRKHYLIWTENDSGVAGCPEPHCSTAAFGTAFLTGAAP